MELVPKQGWIIVDFDFTKDNAERPMHSGKVVSGIKEIGMEVFFNSYIRFNQELVLVKIDDVLAWIKPEVVVDELQNDQA